MKSSYTVIWNTSFPRTEIVKNSHWRLHLYFKIIWSYQADVHYLRSRIKSNFHLPPPVELTKWWNIPGVMSTAQPPANLIRGCTSPYQNNQEQNPFSLKTAATMRSVGQHVHHCIWEHKNTSLQKEALKQRPGLLRQSHAFWNFATNTVSPHRLSTHTQLVSPQSSLPSVCAQLTWCIHSFYKLHILNFLLGQHLHSTQPKFPLVQNSFT